MRSNFMPTFLECRNNLRIHLERLTHGIDRHRHLVRLLKRIKDSPDPHARSILVVAFRIERSLARSTWSLALLPEKRFRRVVPIEDAAFGTLRRTVRPQVIIGMVGTSLTSS